MAAPEADFNVSPGEFQTTAVTLRLLPLTSSAAEFVGVVGAQDQSTKRALEASLSEKLFLLGPTDAGISEEFLQSGRLPVAGADEVVAGWQASQSEQLEVARRTFKVVGVLRRDVALFADSYLLPPDDSLDDLFGPEQTGVRAAALVRLSPGELRSRRTREKLREVYPRGRFARVAPAVRVPRGPYYLYLLGEAMLLFGGSGCMIGLYAGLRLRVRQPLLRAPLRELSRRRRLLWTVHAVYFGLVILASFLVYEVSALQTALLGVVRGEISGGQGVLGIAGRAYESGIIPLAAAVTFLINFLLGSLTHITLPSLIVPGAGVLVAMFRATLWGLLLAPTISSLAPHMLAHNVTLLLEGEGYILAAFFGLLVPVYLFEPRRGRTLPKRYGRAVMMNLKGCLVVAAVLFIAACYEAIEVILLTR